jgi:pimeloyl-ACP methyl ester carboxylesterase
MLGPDRAVRSVAKLSMPVLAIGGEKSFGTTMAKIMQFAATNMREGVIPHAGHWVMEENPTATIAMVRAFLDASI